MFAGEEVMGVDRAAHSIHGKIDMTEYFVSPAHCSVLLSPESRGHPQPHPDTNYDCREL